MFSGDEDFCDQMGKSTIVFAGDGKIDLLTISTINGVKTRKLKDDVCADGHQYQISNMPTFPMGATIKVGINNASFIISVEARVFSTPKLVLDFLHYVFGVDPMKLDVLQICSEGNLGKVWHLLDEDMFNALFCFEDEVDHVLH
ncbi:MAG: hypothetical protein COV45_06040 [Deltaproteobacteria bacterium CG11_big_fil_rev_8_21_14_0_20_47_16]|nr:MAG: hypothetical protein COV45_06040 [Deltaproteobacteria bacterium CG11_big_fil_rev_8_21_14_0_20_47_16]